MRKSQPIPRSETPASFFANAGRISSCAIPAPMKSELATISAMKTLCRKTVR